jgi:hypothetical protein
MREPMSRNWRSDFDELQAQERSAFEKVVEAMRSVHASVNTESQGGLPDYVEEIDQTLEEWKMAQRAMSDFLEEIRAASRLNPESAVD